MISQFSKELSEVLAFSREEADRLSCPSVAPEHLLLAVFRLSDPKIQRLISTLSLDVPTVKKELEQYASSNKEESKRIYEEINVTDRAANVLHLAVLEARIQHRKIVDVEDLILAILHDQTDTGAKMTLQAHHLDYIEANALLRQLANDVQGGLDLSDDDDDDMLFNDDEERIARRRAARVVARSRRAPRRPRVRRRPSTTSARTSRRQPWRGNLTPWWAASARSSASARSWDAARRTILCSSANPVWARVPS